MVFVVLNRPLVMSQVLQSMPEESHLTCHSEEVRSTTEESQNVESQNDSCHSKPAL
ncbi:hypothetical protein [Helicobacter aurati]|uniref:hypothetical protein n=1 Tax=Helicobacter aurati TaxID=137778 RepID=UPI0015F19224|nr:hypothetical protein [Helicobacter aurati]